MSKLREMLLLTAVAGLFPVASPAIAQSPQIVVTGKKVPPGFEAVTKTIKIGDLNLATRVGRQQLEKRVALAVNAVCPKPRGSSQAYERRDYEACRAYAWDGARPQMNRAIIRARGY